MNNKSSNSFKNIKRVIKMNPKKHCRECGGMVHTYTIYKEGEKYDGQLCEGCFKDVYERETDY